MTKNCKKIAYPITVTARRQYPEGVSPLYHTRWGGAGWGGAGPRDNRTERRRRQNFGVYVTILVKNRFPPKNGEGERTRTTARSPPSHHHRHHPHGIAQAWADRPS